MHICTFPLLFLGFFGDELKHGAFGNEAQNLVTCGGVSKKCVVKSV